MVKPGTEVIKLVHAELNWACNLSLFISMVNELSESLKAIKIFIFQHFSFYEQLKFHAHLS